MALAGGPATAACLLVLALAVAAADGATSSPAPAPAPAVDCTAEAFKLAECLEYVTPGNSAPNRPSKACCGEVKTAVKDHVAVGCLCTFFSSKDLPIPINITRVLQLPAACGADPNVFTKCGHAPSPAPAAPSSGSGGAAAAAAPAKGAAAAGRTPVASTTAIVAVAAVAAPLFAFFHL